MYRLMQTTAPTEIGQRLAQLRRNGMAGSATDAAMTYLAELFGRRGDDGIQMATRALRLAITGAQITTLTTSYIERLLIAFDQDQRHTDA